jgi:hypothetical protein
MGHVEDAEHVRRQMMFADEILTNAPESWDGEDSAESIAKNYVHALEQRVIALGGNTAAHDGGQHAALGEFYALARKYVTTGGWNDMADAWDRYKRIRAAAE